MSTRSEVTREPSGLSLLAEEFRERLARSTLLWSSVAAGGRALSLLGRERLAIRLISQAHRSTTSSTLRGLMLPWISKRLSQFVVEDADLPGVDLPRCAGRMLVLKAPVSAREKGVLCVQFNETIATLPRLLDLERLTQQFRLVLEPSWSGACTAELLQYTKLRDRVVVLAAEDGDNEFLRRLGSNLVPVKIGPCDWVDPRVAAPFVGSPKQYDIVMNSNWAGWKRHRVLMRALAQMSPTTKVVLIGVPWGNRTRADVMALAHHYGVADRLTILESIPYAEVMKITASSRVSILLSLKEGSNRALSESIACDVPVVLLDSHVGGIRKNVVPETGMIVSESKLASALEDIISGRRKFEPRKWLLAHSCSPVSGAALNTAVRDVAIASGEEWTQDIVPYSNSPEFTYFDRSVASKLDGWKERVLSYALSAQPRAA
jgi:glycosyltransferase involved in cell wall biosynthesis